MRALIRNVKIQLFVYFAFTSAVFCNAMGYTFISLLVLLCAAQLALCQDCATEEGQIEFVENGAQSNPDCYKPLLTLITGEGSFLPSQLSDVSVST